MPKTKLKIFVSYSHEDEPMKKDLDKSLIMLKRSDKIDVGRTERSSPDKNGMLPSNRNSRMLISFYY